MIFVTVGSQMPFDRLIKAVDDWAGVNPGETVEAQIGNTDYVPRFMTHYKTLTPTQFSERLATASLIVAHAGMGTIISAVEFGKPMVLLPRRGALKETRNDHQVATANWLGSRLGISVAHDVNELAEILTRESSSHRELGLSNAAPENMIAALKKIIARF